MSKIKLESLMANLTDRSIQGAYLFLGTTEETAAEMYRQLKKEIEIKGMPHKVVDLGEGVPADGEEILQEAQDSHYILLFENLGSAPEGEFSHLNDYLKRMTDQAPCPIITYASFDTEGKMARGYGSRMGSAFTKITQLGD